MSIQAIAMFILIVSMLTAYILWRIKEKKEREKLVDDLPVQDDICDYSYNGKTLYLSEDDKRVWNNLSREDKRKIARQQETALQSGKFWLHTDAAGKTGIIRLSEALEKGYVVKVWYNDRFTHMKRADALKKGLL